MIRHSSLLPWVTGSVVTILAILISEWFIQLDSDVHRKQELAQLETRIQHISAQIQKEIDNSLIIIEALESLMLLNNDITQNEFQVLTTRFLSTRPSVRQTQLSPNAIVTYINPHIDSDQVIGLDLKKIPDQSAVVERSILSGQMIMAGPLKLVQGGTGLVTRKPLYNREGLNTRFWGFITVIIDMDALYSEVGIAPQDELAKYAIRGKNAEGLAGEIFFGDPGVFKLDHISHIIEVPGGFWQLAAKLNIHNELHGVSEFLLRGWGVIASFTFGLLSAFTCVLLNKLYLRSIRDPLTQLYNRQYFQEKSVTEIERARKYKQSVSLLMIDLDFFKRVNDSFGHQVGDTVLIQAANLIKSALRDSDLIGRYGGEEFIILLPHDNAKEAQQCAERIRKMLDRKIRIRNQTITLSGSIGIASLSKQIRSYDSLVSAADAALLSAKKQGRNKVVIANEASIIVERTIT